MIKKLTISLALLAIVLEFGIRAAGMEISPSTMQIAGLDISPKPHRLVVF